MFARTAADLGLELGVVGDVGDYDVVEIDAFTADRVNFPEEIKLFKAACYLPEVKGKIIVVVVHHEPSQVTKEDIIRCIVLEFLQDFLNIVLSNGQLVLQSLIFKTIKLVWICCRDPDSLISLIVGSYDGPLLIIFEDLRNRWCNGGF